MIVTVTDVNISVIIKSLQHMPDLFPVNRTEPPDAIQLVNRMEKLLAIEVARLINIELPEQLLYGVERILMGVFYLDLPLNAFVVVLCFLA